MDLQYLHDRERMMIRARWIVLAAALVLLQFQQVQTRLHAPLGVAYLIISVPAAYNLIASAILARTYRPSLSILLLFLDGLVASMGVAISGGLRSPALFFYLFMVIDATRFFGLAGGLLSSALAVGTAGVITLFSSPLPPEELVWSLAIMAAPLLTVSAFSAYDFREERRHRRRLYALNEIRGRSSLVADPERLQGELESVFKRILRAETAEVVFYTEAQPGFSGDPGNGDPTAGVWRSRLEVPGGCLGVVRVGGSRLRSEDADLFRMLVSQAAIVAHNALLYRESQRLARVEERDRLCREFHDGFLNAAAGVLVRLAERARDCERLECPGAAEVERLRRLVEDGLSHLRRVIHSVGSHGTEGGLFGGLQRLAEAIRDGPAVQCSFKGDDRYLSRAVAEEVGKVLREALLNAMRHAAARRIDLSVTVCPTILEATVTDDGTGFDMGEAAGRGLGLGNMRQRAAGLGGQVHIESKPNRGTVVRLIVPLVSEGAAADTAGGGTCD